MVGLSTTSRTPTGRECCTAPTQVTASFSDMVFGFLEEGDFDEDDEKETDNDGNVEEDKSFWKNQHQLLQVIQF
jgi:hypothetical protein